MLSWCLLQISKIFVVFACRFQLELPPEGQNCSQGNSPAISPCVSRFLKRNGKKFHFKYNVYIGFFFFFFPLPFVVTLSLHVLILQTNLPLVDLPPPHFLLSCWIGSFIKPLLTRNCSRDCPVWSLPLQAKLPLLIGGEATDAAWQENSLRKSSHLWRRNAGNRGESRKRERQPHFWVQGCMNTASCHSETALGCSGCKGIVQPLWIRALLYFLREESLINRSFSSEWICFVKFCLSQLCLEQPLGQWVLPEVHLHSLLCSQVCGLQTLTAEQQRIPGWSGMEGP